MQFPGGPLDDGGPAPGHAGLGHDTSWNRFGVAKMEQVRGAAGDLVPWVRRARRRDVQTGHSMLAGDPDFTRAGEHGEEWRDGRIGLGFQRAPSGGGRIVLGECGVEQNDDPAAYRRGGNQRLARRSAAMRDPSAVS